MIRSHSIDCDHDDCGAWSTRTALKSTTPDQLATEHRAALAADGWTDLEARDYCPDHNPMGATR